MRGSKVLVIWPVDVVPLTMPLGGITAEAGTAPPMPTVEAVVPCDSEMLPGR